MSYDVYLEIDGGNEYAEVYWRNHTSNTAAMWREAGCDIAEHHNGDAHGFGIALTFAIADIEYRPGHYAQWEPENRWGTVESTLGFLRDLQAACERYPSAVVRVCR